MQIKDDRAVIDLLEPSSEAPEAIAVDATHIYWSSTDTTYPADQSCAGMDSDRDKLLRLPKDAKLPAAPVTPETTLWNGCGKISTLVIGDSRVYGARTSGHRVTWVEKDRSDKGHYPTGVSDPQGGPVGVAADGDIVYFTDRVSEQLFFDDTGDDEKEKPVLEGIEAPGLLVVDDANLYWLTDSNVLRETSRCPSSTRGCRALPRGSQPMETTSSSPSARRGPFTGSARTRPPIRR
jgi:hypothetical protein